MLFIRQQAMTGIEEDVGLRGLRITKAIDGGAARGGDLDTDIEAGQRYRLEPGGGLLVGAG